MKKALFLLTILFCCLLNAVAQQEIEPEEYQVYKDWLEKSIISPETKQIDIVNFTADNVHGGISSLYESRNPLTKLLQSSTSRNYKLRNRNSYALSNDFGMKPIVNFINKDGVDTYRGTSKTYLNFEDKSSIPWVFTFSRVGFNKDKTQALFHVEYGYFGYFWLLSKKNGKWIVQKGRKSWEY